MADIVQVELSFWHSCALHAEGTVSCWGILNQFGTLGNGTGVDSPTTPVLVSGLSDAESISVQSLRTCAVRSTGGAVCWGQTVGPPGMVSTPHDVIARTLGGDVPATGIRDIGSGADFLCVLRVDDQIFCSGSDSKKLAGLGGPASGPPDVLTTPMPDLPPIRSIDVELSHMCATSYEDDVFCWGSNDNGQVGDGTTAPARLPVLVASYRP